MIRSTFRLPVIKNAAREFSAVVKVESLKDWNTFVDVKTPFIAYFTASWCGPCRAIAPFYEELASKNSTIRFAKVDVDEASDLASMMRIRSVPTFYAYESDGKLASTFSGADRKQLQESVNKLMA